MKGLKLLTDPQSIIDAISSSFEALSRNFDLSTGGKYSGNSLEYHIDDEVFILEYAFDNTCLVLRREAKNSPDLLVFSAWSDKTGAGRTAGGVAVDEGGRYYLIHDGRVTPSDRRARPTWNVILQLHKQYYVIGRLESPQLFNNIIAYHRSRLDPGSDPEPEPHPTFDPGPKGTGERASTIWSAKHHPLSIAFKKNLDSSCNLLKAKNCRPDFYINKGGENFVVEVKPDNRLQSIVTAIGQVLFYSAVTGASRRVIVCPPLSFETVWGESLADVVKTNGIDFIFAAQAYEQYEFTENDSRLLDRS